jgi:hypothetical protein
MLHCTECLIIRNVCNTSERDHWKHFTK